MSRTSAPISYSQLTRDEREFLDLVRRAPRRMQAALLSLCQVDIAGQRLKTTFRALRAPEKDAFVKIAMSLKIAQLFAEFERRPTTKGGR